MKIAAQLVPGKRNRTVLTAWIYGNKRSRLNARAGGIAICHTPDCRCRKAHVHDTKEQA